MKFFALLGLICTLMIIVVGIWLIRQHSPERNYTESYEIALQNHPGIRPSRSEAEESLERFVRFFNNLQSPELETRIQHVFAQNLYVNDTTHQFNHIGTLTNYFAKLAEMVDYLQLERRHFWVEDNDIWVHWKMRYRITIGQKESEISSYGVSLLRIDQSGKVIFQQDFWDPNNGLYRSIPYIGTLHQSVTPFQRH